MGELLMRRREMMANGAQKPKLIYELASPVTTANANYDTGIKLFSPQRSFTILLEARFCNRNWASSQSIFSIDGTTNVFRIGRASSLNYWVNNAFSSSGKNFYTAFIMNNTASDADKKKCNSITSRATSDTSYITKRMSVRFDINTLKCDCGSDTGLVPNSRWWTVSDPISNAKTLKLIVNSVPAGTCSINIFKIYDGAMSDDDTNDFLSGRTN